MRKRFAAGNWKMNTSLDDGLKLATDVLNMVGDEVKPDVNVVVIPPFTHLSSVGKVVAKSKVGLGAQNCHQKDAGAYTGEVSVGMLISTGVAYVVIGHSERRAYFHETDEILRAKVDQVLAHNLCPIFCCGEQLEIRNEGGHFELVMQQVENALYHLSADEMKKVVIAYEPVWAIGTGVTASNDQAQEMHAHIRSGLATKYGREVAEEISILYGGSVKATNAAELFACPDVDGGLIGGASLDARGFVDIARSFS